jgi:hypothetical protein
MIKESREFIRNVNRVVMEAAVSYNADVRLLKLTENA